MSIALAHKKRILEKKQAEIIGVDMASGKDKTAVFTTTGSASSAADKFTYLKESLQEKLNTLKALNGKPMRMVCVFNPPVTGRETHDADGSYNLPE